MCRTVRTNFGYPILVIKNRWKGCTKAKKIENSVYFNCYKYSLFFICIKKKKLCFNSQKILNTAEQFN